MLLFCQTFCYNQNKRRLFTFKSSNISILRACILKEEQCGGALSWRVPRIAPEQKKPECGGSVLLPENWWKGRIGSGLPVYLRPLTPLFGTILPCLVCLFLSPESQLFLLIGFSYREKMPMLLKPEREEFLCSPGISRREDVMHCPGWFYLP